MSRRGKSVEMGRWLAGGGGGVWKWEPLLMGLGCILGWWKCSKMYYSDGCATLWIYQKPLNIYLFILFILIYLWLCWVLISVRGLSLGAASGGHSSSWCAGLSLSRPLLLRSTGSRRAGSVVEAHGPSCSAACGIFSDQGLNPCPLHWQADSQPLRHQGSPTIEYLNRWIVWCVNYISLKLLQVK